MTEIPRITVPDVEDAIARGRHVVFVDARKASDWASADQQIRGSVRVPPDDIDRHLDAVPRADLVVTYCT